MTRIIFFCLSVISFILIALVWPGQLKAAGNKYKILHIDLGNKDICVTDPSGPYQTLTDCQDALANQQHPGKFKIGTVLGSVPSCVPDNSPSASMTWSQCQDALANQLNPGQFKIAQAGTLGVTIDTCVADPTGPYTFSECKDALTNQKAGGGPLGKNPCEGGTCDTALGEIPTNPQALAAKILQIATGVGGGIALILMVIGSIKVLTSSGDQQKLSGGRDMIVAAIAGLLFLIFSVLILRFIGIQIIGL